ncbi:hypothetical protein NB550_20665 [Vibrio parahaemolyticus]|uniref:hypothetical protein n=1 Tax=Vibrio parahaemolyticus TaxID=670 RepID=UPI000470FEA8|nr:hypothetical protein [Vibrio parahaemolyticus]EKH9212783.1 hypothetical protein [Vibrio parahaemolyticus]MBY4653448.1 hypothetical protein [Vibrio parahaemolyticus]MCR9766283.1 hypothetical protein [Vibrio parahaemolyticus]MCR9891731.1 hypothetical protein [Vibrio parahaemolyticus]MCR9919902.1 hypothetical protein [Vibrio parahaemolyticus]
MGQAHFEHVLALYQYATNAETAKHLELLIVHKVPASYVATLMNTSLQQLSRTLKRYQTKLNAINENRSHFTD